MKSGASRMSIIGFGRMGQFFTKLFVPGFDVVVVSSRDVRAEVESLGAKFAPDFSEAVRLSDYIFIAVPVDALDSVIEQINRHARPEAIVIDTCSARVAAEQKLSRLKCQHFGIHAGAVTGAPSPTIMEYLRRQGHHFQPMSPEEHDRLNTTVGLVHFIGMVFDSYLQEKDRKELMSGMVGPLLLEIIDHMRGNSVATYRETQLLNSFMKDRRQEFLEALIEYSNRLERGEFPFDST